MKFLKAKRVIETHEAVISFPIAILAMLATVNLGIVVYGQQAAARHGARIGSVAQQCGACHAASSTIDSNSIVKEPSVAILSPGGVAGSILSNNIAHYNQTGTRKQHQASELAVTLDA